MFHLNRLKKIFVILFVTVVLGSACILYKIPLGGKLPEPTASVPGSLRLATTAYYWGDQIPVAFTAPASFPPNAWIGVIPADVPHGDCALNLQNVREIQYINGVTSGVLIFTAPEPAGNYEFRMFSSDQNGIENTSTAFVSTDDGNLLSSYENTLKLDRDSFWGADFIKVFFTVEVGEHFKPDAWIGIVPANTEHGSEDINELRVVERQYLDGRQSGILIFDAPTAAGLYEFRMFDADQNGVEKASVSFEVHEY